MSEQQQMQQTAVNNDEDNKSSSAAGSDDYSVVYSVEEDGNGDNDAVDADEMANALNNMDGDMQHHLIVSKLVVDMKNINKEFHDYRNEMAQKLVEKDELIAKQGLELSKFAQSIDHFESVNTARCYATTLPVPDANRRIIMNNRHAYSNDLDKFIRYGASLCTGFHIKRSTASATAFTGYPKEFFNNLIMYAHQTRSPEEMVKDLVIDLKLDDPAEWPKPMIQVLMNKIGGQSYQVTMDIPGIVEKSVVLSERVVHYGFNNKHKPEFRFNVRVYFSGDANIYKQMSAFCMQIEN